MTTGHNDHWTKFRQLKKVMQKECRRSYNEYINNIICGDTQDTSTQNNRNKKFYGYIKSLRRDSSGVASLKKDGIAFSDSSKKAEILNDQFSSVFTNEDSPPPVDITGVSPYPDMPPIDVQVNGVAQGSIHTKQQVWINYQPAYLKRLLMK